MRVKPLPHLLITPLPLKLVGVQPVVLRPRDVHVIDELRAASPRRAPQVAMTEGPDQQLRLVQPRRAHRREPGTPPAPAVLPEGGRGAGRVAGVAVLDQEDPLEAAMPAAEPAQLLDVVH